MGGGDGNFEVSVYIGGESKEERGSRKQRVIKWRNLGFRVNTCVRRLVLTALEVL